MVKTKSKTAPTWDDRLKDFYGNIKTERERYLVSQHELDAIIGELIDTLDRHFIESAFNFRTGQQSGHPYVEGFVDKLKPHARVIEKRLRPLLPAWYPNWPTADPDADLTTMIADLEQAAYAIGIFMGAKLAGASAERLNLLRKHLIF